MGFTQYSQLHEKSFPVAVSFSIPEHVDGLSSSFILNNFELNPSEVLLAKSKLKAHKDAVQERKQRPAEPDAKATKQNEQPYEPTDVQIFVMANFIMSAHPETYNLLSQIDCENQAKWINQKIWGKSSVIVVVNPESGVVKQDASGSWYCRQTALATMHDLAHRLRHIGGERVMVITPYNAQLSLLLALRDAAHRNAVANGDQTLADELTRVMVVTVDSSMGKDREHVVFDSVGRAEGFLWRQPRTLVAGTRARSSFIFVGPLKYCMSRRDIKDRLKAMVYVWLSEGLIVTLNDTRMSKLEQYHAVRFS